MAKIEFPPQLKKLLEDSDLQAPVRALADRVGEILADNKLPFFPDYTDHGVEHVNRVLKTEVELVPKSVWGHCGKDSDPRPLSEADAAVIIGATLLHDIAMHLRPDGFLELVSKGSRFTPLSWFMEDQENHRADRPWDELWLDYVREARRFSDRDLTNIIGEESARVWKFHELPKDTGQWETNHRLVIGEFIRRHHARLAHEIAIHGFPGLPAGSGEGCFPAMGKEDGHPLRRLADLIGLAARSHGLSLRVCIAYLEASQNYAGTPQPMGSAVLYPMALLRVADYLQIDRQRAPAVLLNLRNPQSPISVQEWQKHRAVQHIGPATDPRGKMVKVSSDLSLPLYLQLKELLQGLQAEMDHATAVLDEAYGNFSDLGLNQLNLATRRVHSNLQTPAFRDNLPYVPKETGFSADPHILSLLVEPLYGKEPSVGVRELMQNAADAVVELDAWCKAHGVPMESLDLPEQEGDVMVDFIQRDDGSWFLRVTDRGIGMTADTLQNYFLRAGASFRRSAEWAKEFTDEEGKPTIARAGRFGIGAFAIFLLGPSFKLWTRHVTADKSKGYMIEVAANSQLIEISRMDGLPVGTSIEVQITNDSIQYFGLLKDNLLGYLGQSEKTDWFCWDWPKTITHIIRNDLATTLPQNWTYPIRKGNVWPEWSAIYPHCIDAVFWTFRDKHGNSPSLSCNGLKIGLPNSSYQAGEMFRRFWPASTHLKCPTIAVLDSVANLPLTAQRYDLSDESAFLRDMLVRDVLFSYIGHALTCGPTSQAEAMVMAGRYPLCVKGVSECNESSQKLFADSRARWCVTMKAMAPADPWLYSLLGSPLCVIYGALGLSDSRGRLLAAVSTAEELVKEGDSIGAAFLSWETILRHHWYLGSDNVEDFSGWPQKLLSRMVTGGVEVLGPSVGCQVIACDGDEPFFEGREESIWDDSDEEANDLVCWTRLQKRSRSDNSRFEVKTGDFDISFPIESLLSVMETSSKHLDLYQNRAKSGRAFQRDAVLFVAQVRTRRAEIPESPLAKIWNECLGPQPIPFDPEARKALIEHGKKHPDLRRHIEAWEEMKRTGSKWATGEWESRG